MRRLARFTLFLLWLTAIALLVLGQMSIHPKSTQALRKAIFTNPDGSSCEKPCLFGVIPGQTTVEEGTTILQAHPYITNVLRLGTIKSGSGESIIACCKKI